MNESPEAAAAGSDVVVARTLSRKLDEVWAALMSPKGAEALLGPGAKLPGKGEDWQASDGSRGVVRSFHPKEQIRFSFHESDDAPASLVELDLAGEGDATNLTLRNSKLAQDADQAAVRERWEKVLDRIDAACGD